MRQVLGVALLLNCALLLAGCQTAGRQAGAERLAAEHDTQCRSWGHQKSSAGYAQCRQTLYLEEQKRIQASVAYMNGLQNRQPVTLQIDQSPQRSPIHCTSTINSGIGQTNCY